MATFMQDDQRKLQCYILLGTCFRQIRKHQTALNCFTKGIQYAWKTGDKSAEIQLYDHIGLEYHFLQKPGRANYYHKRFFNAEIEPDTSEVKNLSQRLMEEKEMVTKGMDSHILYLR